MKPSTQGLFDRFYRVNSDRSRSSGGSGLDLAIAFAIVQANQGNFNVQSELGYMLHFYRSITLRCRST